MVGEKVVDVRGHKRSKPRRKKRTGPSKRHQASVRAKIIRARKRAGRPRLKRRAKA